MSSTIKKGLIVSILLISAGLSFYFFQQPNAFSRPPSDFLQSKFSSKGVVDRIIQLRLNYDKVELDSEKAAVTAEINMPFDFNDKLFFKWKLGQDVVLTDGEISGEISTLLKNETKKVMISVSGFSKENNHQIGFEIYGVKNGKKIFGDAMITSDIESTFENTVQNVEKIKASQ